MPKDLDQAKKMVNMRIKIDVWTKGIKESIREEIREKLRDLFCQLPPRRVWYYLKYIRELNCNGSINSENPGSGPEMGHGMDGPEDVIVNCMFP